MSNATHLSYDEAEALASRHHLILDHDCDYTDPSCDCEEPHAPGDTLCAHRADHRACPHDLERIGELERQYREEMEVAARRINGDLNLFGQESVNDLLDASWDAAKEEALLSDWMTPSCACQSRAACDHDGSDFPAWFVAEAEADVAEYRTLAEKWRDILETTSHD